MESNRMERGSLPSRSRGNGRSTARSVGSRSDDRGGFGGGRSRRSTSGGGNGGNQKRFRFFNKKWILLVLLTSLLLVIGGCSAIFFTGKTYSIDEAVDAMASSSSIYDKNGKPVIQLGGSNREYVKLKDIKSPELAKAFVAVEDERFREHNGVDFRGLGRAVVRNIISFGKAEGASTITMQVARNIVLKNSEKTYSRKLSEMAVAMTLERNASKDTILEKYLNYIELGNDVRGIKMAAKIYFGKDITKQKLKPQEIALLAGLPKAPYGYNPYVNKEEALNRRNTILNKMAEDTPGGQIITEAEAEKAKKTGLGVNKKYLKKYLKRGQYAAYRDYVLSEIKERYFANDPDKLKDLVDGGYKIKTSLNPKVQLAAERALKNDSHFRNKAGQVDKNLDSGLTLMNRGNGRVVAVGGGRNYITGNLSRATQKIQPGSAIKPITVFAPAVKDHNFNEYSTVKDEKISIGNWTPKNQTRRYYGQVPMQEMVSKSLNASTIWLLNNYVKRSAAASYAEKAGIELDPKDKGSYAALGLGGFTQGTSTVKMAQAYSALANNGSNTEAHAVLKLIDRNGEEVKPDKPIVEDKQVYDPKTAYYMTRMLRKAVQTGTGVNAQLADGRPVAGKTGTTQNSKESWFVGYTTDYVAAVNVFKDNDTPTDLSGGGFAAPIWKDVMTVAEAGKPIRDFKRPPGVKEPSPPFELKQVSDLSGSFDANAKAINLKWTDYDQEGRVKYRIERSEDGSSWSPVGESQDGGYSDSSIEVPEEKSGWDKFWGGDDPAEKEYYYRVIAIDTKDQSEADPSSPLKITAKSGEDGEKPPPEDEQPQGGDQQGNPQAGDQQGNPQGGAQQGGSQGGQGDDTTPPPGGDTQPQDPTGGTPPPGQQQGTQGNPNRPR
ncbi:penicillin-binding protein 2A [Marininema mesophilum]|uniref:Penicillin-binding protein 2A n=1 Tax=Marininema mesophilum TaxID=1048340 RepID=A0A1H2YYT1_9BACL|nr:transglycosylase domain-containing protein [Marininema mesophilum]SDX10352.1 penicillin-binding protein 2A [Marininema mesophilum]